jgi:hypothetical protein
VLWQVELAARLDLQKISGLGQAIAFADHRVGADSQQCPFLGPAGSVLVAAAAAYFMDGLTERRVCCLMRLKQRRKFVGRFLDLARRLSGKSRRCSRRGNDGAAGFEKQDAAIDPGHGELSSSLHGTVRSAS